MTGESEMTKATAQRLSDITRALGDQLMKAAKMIQDAESREVFDAYKQGIGNVMGAMYDEILGPLYKEHPDIEPPEQRPK
jgi:hypothetical protein